MNEQHLNELESILKEYLSLNKARLYCLLGMIIGLLQVKRLSLPQLSIAFPSKAKPSSNLRRIHRFIKEVSLDYDDIARFIFRLFDFARQDIYLSVDRTNWKWGQKNINILVLGVVYKGAAIPIYWLMLNKRGNSNTKERIALIKRFISVFPEQNLLGLLGDREFIGDDWLDWLNLQNIPYYIRVKKNHVSTNSRGLEVDIDGLFYHLQVGESVHLKGKRKLGTQKVYLSGLRLSDGELLIVASNIDNHHTIEIYGKRWEIETLFGNLKGRGFHLEDTRVTKLVRLKKLLFIPVIAFCWAHKCGEYMLKSTPIKMKKHGRLARSIFRHGLDKISLEFFRYIGSSNIQIRKIIALLKEGGQKTSAKGAR